MCVCVCVQIRSYNHKEGRDMSHPDKSREKCSPVPPNGDVRLPARAIPKTGKKKKSKGKPRGWSWKTKRKRKRKEKKRRVSAKVIPSHRRETSGKSPKYRRQGKRERRERPKNPKKESPTQPKVYPKKTRARTSVIMNPHSHPLTGGYYAHGPGIGQESGVQR